MDGPDNERGQEHPGILLNMLGRVDSDVRTNKDSFLPQRLLEPLNKAGNLEMGN